MKNAVAAIGLCLYGCVLNAGTIVPGDSAIELIMRYQDEDAIAEVFYGYGIAGDRLSFLGFAGASGNVVISDPTWEDYQRDPRAEASISIAMKFTTIGPVREGFIKYNVYRGGDGSGGGYGGGWAYVDRFYPIKRDPRTWYDFGTATFTLGQEFSAGLSASGSGWFGGSTTGNSSLSFELFEQDGVTAVPIYWASEVPEPGTIGLCMTAMLVLAVLFRLRRSPSTEFKVSRSSERPDAGSR